MKICYFQSDLMYKTFFKMRNKQGNFSSADIFCRKRTAQLFRNSWNLALLNVVELSLKKLSFSTNLRRLLEILVLHPRLNELSCFCSCMAHLIFNIPVNANYESTQKIFRTAIFLYRLPQEFNTRHRIV